jgi:hypothetical protein
MIARVSSKGSVYSGNLSGGGRLAGSIERASILPGTRKKENYERRQWSGLRAGGREVKVRNW